MLMLKEEIIEIIGSFFMKKQHKLHPTFTDITCEKCDGLCFILQEDAWRPKHCECMEDAPKIVEPYKKD